MTGRDYIQMAADYQAAVLDGTIPACKWVKLACARNRRDLDHQNSPEFPFYFDPEAGSRVCRMGEMLPHVKGPKAFICGQDEDGRPIWNPIVLEPWQCWIFTTLFGWKRQDNNLRRFRVSLCLVPRKNSKSSMAAIIVLYMLVADGESGAECYCLDPSTRVLDEEFRWRPVGDVKVGQHLIGFDEESSGHRKYRKLRQAIVNSVERIIRPCYRIVMEDGREVIASAEHMWLGQTGRLAERRLWLRTDALKPGALIRDLGQPWADDNSRDGGYLAGIFDGEGSFHQRQRKENGDPGKGDGFRLAFAQVPGPIMDKVHGLCESFGFSPTSIHDNKVSSAHWFGIAGFYNCARFLGQLRPERLLTGAAAWYQGRTPNRLSSSAAVKSVEFVGDREVVAIGTSTRTLFAEGLFSHNSAATTRDQAKTIAEIAWEMSKRSPGFREYFGVRLGSETTKSLAVPATGSKFMPLSADAHTLDSLNVSLAAIDELHAHRTAAVWNVLDTATGARLQPLLFAITTAGIDIGGVCHMKMGYLEKILDGVFTDETFFGTNYSIDPGDDITDPVIQRKANPNYGVSVDPDDLQRKVRAAFLSPADLNDKLTKHFNVWIRTESAWMTATLWNTCGRVGRTMADYRAFPLWIGVDLAEVRDIAALMALFRIGPGKYAAFGRFYLPADTVDKSPVAELSGWVREGYIIETPGDQADFKRIEDDIVDLYERFLVEEIDFDRALAAQMQQSLKARFEPRIGRDAVERLVITVPQNVENMDAAMKMTERLVLAGNLEHDANPAMGWMISNVVVERNYKDEIYPRKAGGKDSPHKIDGPVALFTALSQAMRAKELPPAFQMLTLGGKR